MNVSFKHKNNGIPAFQQVLEAFPSKADLVVNALDQTRGFPCQSYSSTLGLLCVLANSIDSRQPTIIEVGTNRGATAAVMSFANPSAKIITIEISHDNADIAIELLKRPLSHHGYNFGNVNVIVDDAVEVEKEFIGKIDMVFIDGDHAAADKDMPWWNRLVPGGVIAFHDYYPDYPNVMDTADKLCQIVGRKFDVYCPVESGFVAVIKREGDPKWR